MSLPDPYEILGVKPDATEEDIRAAYRALARQHHPDVNKATDAAERFNEVQQAYDLLSDPEKRAAYDRFGKSGAPFGAGGGDPFAGYDATDLGSLFETFFGGAAAQRQPGRARAGRRAVRGADQRAKATVSLEEVATGATRSIRVARGGSTRSIDAKIPAGIADGATLRIGGQGRPGRGGGPAGDLLITVHVSPHPIFRRGTPGSPDPASPDLTCDLPLELAEAIRGTTLRLRTLTGPVDLRVPPGTTGGAKLRLRGRGLPVPAGGSEPASGHLYVVAQIHTPTPDLLDGHTLNAIDALPPAAEREGLVVQTDAQGGRPPA